MEILEHLFVLAHLLGMAAIIGSAVFVARGAATPALVWGARAQLVTGLILVGLAQAEDDAVNNTKIAVKLLVAVAVVACAEIAAAKERKGEGARPQLVNAAGALALLNVAVAVLWR
ncbi:MAG TPA: hypothetical protein VES93_03735 [Ornithinibacter sp.]|nr:hypothetical protein [Ornithinibacter sp.]